MPDIHPMDEAAAEITRWLEEEPSYYAEALRGGRGTPFAANTSEAEKLDYYARQVFMKNPDGTPKYDTPNDAGREELLQRVGSEGYREIMTQLLRRQARSAPTPDTTGDMKMSSYQMPEASGGTERVDY
jgi:hypothetical protein